MGDSKINMDTFTPSASNLFTQSSLLFLSYGMGFNMPWWVLWFPFLVNGIMLVITLVILIIGIILNILNG